MSEVHVPRNGRTSCLVIPPWKEADEDAVKERGWGVRRVTCGSAGRASGRGCTR